VTSTLDTTPLHRAAAGTAALLVGRLPFVFEPAPVNDRPGALVAPGEGSLALSAGIVGVEGSTVILALPAAVIAALVDGPLGHQELTDALTPVLTDAVAGLEPMLGPGVALEAPNVIPADLALESLATAGVQTMAVTLRANAGEDGLLVIALPISTMELAPVGAPSGLPAFEVDAESLDLLGDVEMSVTAVLGRTRLTVRHLLGLAVGYVVELDRGADSAVDLLVNGTLVARGEVVVIDDEFGVRITEIVGKRGRA
jgi:flagellar motor switch protein FliN/FliY